MSVNRRSIMTLYSSDDPYSHRVRIVLAEKEVTVDILDIASLKFREELQEINPYNAVPTLVDRDLVLFRSEIIMEYLDERFPHPPLMPVYPIAKGRSRLMIYRINQDWYTHLDLLLSPNTTDAAKEQAKKDLHDSIIGISGAFGENPYFLSEEFSLVDCCIAPLLWRLPTLGISLENPALQEYMERVFKRPAFQASLTDRERLMRV